MSVSASVGGTPPHAGLRARRLEGVKVLPRVSVSGSRPALLA